MPKKDSDTTELDHVVWRLKPGRHDLTRKDIAYYKRKHGARKVLIINDRGELVYYDK